MTMIPTREQIPQIARLGGPMGMPRMGPPAAGASGMTAQDILRVLRKRKWLILLSLVICVAMAAAVTLLWLAYYPFYTAQAAVRVSPPGQTVFQRGVMTAEAMDRNKLTMAQMARAPDVIQKTIDSPRVKGTLWFRDHQQDLITTFISQTDVSPIRDTELIKLSMTGRNPEDLAKIVGAWATTFVAVANETSQDASQRTARGLDQTIGDLRRSIQDIDNAIGSKPMPDDQLIQRSIAMLTQELQTLTSQNAEANLALKRVMFFSNSFEAAAKDPTLGDPIEVGNSLAGDPFLQSLNAQLGGLNIQLDAQSSDRTGPGHPGSRDLASRIESMKKRIAEREEDVRKRTIEQVRQQYLAQIEQLTAMLQDIERRMEKDNQLVKGLQSGLSELVDLQLKKRRKQADLDLLERRQMELMLTSGQEPPLIIYQPPEEPREPSMPRWALMIPLGAMLGLVVGLGLSFLLEFIDTSIKSPTDISRRVDLPLLGMVPHTEDLDEEIADLRLAFMTNPNSLVGEAFRQIRTCLQFSAPAAHLRSLLITSALPGDGRGTVTMNLAAATAHSGRKILVVDANFRQPMIKKILPQCPDAGLSNVLVGQSHWKDLVREVHPNLFVLGSGPQPPNPSELLGSDAMRSAMAEFIAEYDQVLFDGPPCLLVTDAAVLSTLVDGVVLVVRAASNTHGVVQRARDVLGHVGARVLGVVLNGIRVTSGGYLRRNYRTFYEYHTQGTAPSS